MPEGSVPMDVGEPSEVDGDAIDAMEDGGLTEQGVPSGMEADDSEEDETQQDSPISQARLKRRRVVAISVHGERQT